VCRKKLLSQQWGEIIGLVSSPLALLRADLLLENKRNKAAATGERERERKNWMTTEMELFTK
jgi:hypothetical protein